MLRRFESCRGHITSVLGLMTVVMWMAMRLISICAPERCSRTARREVSTEKPCSLDGCGRPVRAKGLCNPHYIQQERGKSLTPIRKRTPKHTGCGEKGCEKTHYSKGLCRNHYAKMQRNK